MFRIAPGAEYILYERLCTFQTMVAVPVSLNYLQNDLNRRKFFFDMIQTKSMIIS